MIKTTEQVLTTLKGLQGVDDRLRQYREKVAALSLRVDEHRKRVTDFEAEMEKKTAELKVGEKDTAKKELDLKVIQEKIEKLRGQLNILTSNKQYSAMVHEIGGHQADSARTEEEALAIMDRVENTRTAIETIRLEIKGAQEAVRAEEAAVADEIRAFSGAIRELSAERLALVQQLDKPVAAIYGKIAHSRNGKAVVAVKQGICQGCFMGITRQMIARLWAKKELLHCPNCARVIYLEGEVQ
jgi:hypothetical protein